MRRVLTTCLLGLGVGQAAVADEPFRLKLNQVVSTPPFAASAVTMLNVGRDVPVTVGEVLRLDRWTLEFDRSLTHRNYLELREVFRAAGLDLHLTTTEIEFFVRRGQLPPPSIHSMVDRLDLSFATRAMLRGYGIKTIKQTAQLCRETLDRAGVAGRQINEVTAAVAPFGITVWPTEEEHALARLGRLTPEAIPLSQEPIGRGLLPLLQRLDIWSIAELKHADRTTDLFTADGIKAAARRHVVNTLARHHHAAAWVQAVRDLGLPADVTEKLRAQKIFTRRDLMLMLRNPEGEKAAGWSAEALAGMRARITHPTCTALLN